MIEMSDTNRFVVFLSRKKSMEDFVLYDISSWQKCLVLIDIKTKNKAKMDVIINKRDIDKECQKSSSIIRQSKCICMWKVLIKEVKRKGMERKKV